jgi:hypothetical protein
MDKTPLPAADPLAGLIDAPLPAAISLWPQTWFAWSAVVIIAALVVVATSFAIWRWRRNRYRRAANRDMIRIQRALTRGAPHYVTVQNLALLVRRTALVSFPRTSVASLSGTRWLSFLDRSYDGSGFSQGVGRVLAAAPYEPSGHADVPMGPLFNLIQQWIWTHHD